MADQPPALTIPSVTVLTGHTDVDSAYLVEDYPYGGGLRCHARFWVETGEKKPNKGAQRFVRQTTNPNRPGDVWNRPRYHTYAKTVTLYLDAKDDVQPHALHWVDGPIDTRLRHMGIYRAWDDEQRARYDAWLVSSRRLSPLAWSDWDATVARLADEITARDGADPLIVDRRWKDEVGRPFHLSDPAAYVVAARDLIAARASEV